MKKSKLKIILLLLAFVIIISFSLFCSLGPEYDPNVSEEKNLLEDDRKEENYGEKDSSKYKTAFGIDYSSPEEYLIQGEQSKISDKEFLKDLKQSKKNLEHLKIVYDWLKNNFTSYSAGGKTIGKVTVDELLEKRKLGGCHDYGLLYAAVIRELGYPSVMVRTASINWIKKFQEGKEEAQLHVGHVFVEVFLQNEWILIDPTNGWYVNNGYKPANPVIPLKGRVAGPNEEVYGFYVEHKGLDIWDFGIYSQQDSTNSMDQLANQIVLDKLEYPDYTFLPF